MFSELFKPSKLLKEQPKTEGHQVALTAKELYSAETFASENVSIETVTIHYCYKVSCKPNHATNKTEFIFKTVFCICCFVLICSIHKKTADMWWGVAEAQLSLIKDQNFDQWKKSIP